MGIGVGVSVCLNWVGCREGWGGLGSGLARAPYVLVAAEEAEEDGAEAPDVHLLVVGLLRDDFGGHVPIFMRFRFFPERGVDYVDVWGQSMIGGPRSIDPGANDHTRACAHIYIHAMSDSKLTRAIHRWFGASRGWDPRRAPSRSPPTVFLRGGSGGGGWGGGKKLAARASSRVRSQA